MNPARRALVSVPAVAALAWAATLCVSAANANVIASAAPSDVASLERALEWAPADPELHEGLGVAMLKLGPGLRRGDVVAGLRRGDEALPSFERALLLRPTSPYAWANYAEARYRQGRADAVFETALVRAAELGPSEPEVQATVALYGLAVWNESRPQTREAVERMVAAGMKRDPGAMLRIADRRGRLDVACAHAEAARPIPELSKSCNNRETPK